jgi:hypothetical protein
MTVPLFDRAASGQSLLERELALAKDILLVRPVTENSSNWKADWTELVRKRSTQYARLLRKDPRFVRRVVAPDGPDAATNGVRATLYTKVHD